MNFRVLMCVGAGFAGAPSIAAADYFTGNQMHEFCTTQPRVVSGYIAGWIGKREDDTDVMLKLYKLSPASQNKAISQAGDVMMAACIPDNASLGQLRDIFCKALAETPEVRHESATTFLSAVLSVTFPCPK